MDKEFLKNTCEYSTIHEDLQIKEYNIPLFLAGMNGIYILLDTDTEEDKLDKAIATIKEFSNVFDNQIFFFYFRDDESGKFFDYTEGWIEFENITDAFLNCYFNKMLPQDVLLSLSLLPKDFCFFIEYTTTNSDYSEKYIEPVLSTWQMDMLEEKIKNIDDFLISKNEKYITNSDGDMFIKRTVTKKIGIFDTYLSTDEQYFPCMEISGEDFFKLTLFGGIFGIHKLKTKQYANFIFYLLTCGGCGLFYILDLISILIGGYHYIDKNDNQSIYVRPINANEKRKYILLIIIFGLLSLSSFLVVTNITIPLIKTIIQLLSIPISTVIKETSTNINFI